MGFPDGDCGRVAAGHGNWNQCKLQKPPLVRAMIHAESGFNVRARSQKGALGLMQVMPASARSLPRRA